MVSAPLAGITLRTQVGKHSDTHLVTGSSSIRAHKESNEGRTRRLSQQQYLKCLQNCSMFKISRDSAAAESGGGVAWGKRIMEATMKTKNSEKGNQWSRCVQRRYTGMICCVLRIVLKRLKTPRDGVQHTHTHTHL